MNNQTVTSRKLTELLSKNGVSKLLVIKDEETLVREGLQGYSITYDDKDGYDLRMEGNGEQFATVDEVAERVIELREFEEEAIKDSMWEYYNNVNTYDVDIAKERIEELLKINELEYSSENEEYAESIIDEIANYKV